MLEKMPEEYKGKNLKATNNSKTQRRAWSDEEVNYLQNCLLQGYTAKEISYKMDRSLRSIKLKINRVKQANKTYNNDHKLEKYEYNGKFLDLIQPDTVLDLYNGGSKQYSLYNVVTNDIDKSISCDYNIDALKLLCKLYYDGEKFDLIDLDPFGSAYDCFDLAIKMSKKGLIITFGEIGLKRFKYLDFVSSRYGITSLDEFTVENLIKKVQLIGESNKKKLSPVYVLNWQSVSRVYFKVNNIKKDVWG